MMLSQSPRKIIPTQNSKCKGVGIDDAVVSASHS